MDEAAITARPGADGGSTIPDVSIMIVAYNSAALIADCIAAIPQACQRYRQETLLIDNGDGSTEALVAARFSWVRIVPSQGNIGFAGGNNVIAGHARAPRLLLLNPDMVAHPGSIDRLIDGALANPDAGAWGGLTLDREGQPDTGNAIAIPSLIELASTAMGKSLVASRPILGIDTDAEVDVLCGGFVMFSREAWDAARGLDERFFLYCEEVDLFCRLKQKGYRFWRIAGARATHIAGHGNTLSPMRLLYRAAGTMEFVRAHWRPAHRWLAGFLVWLAAAERWLAGRLIGRWNLHLRELGNGYRLVAIHPAYWIFGYHKGRGLMAKLARSPLKP
ncbi:glycosyltransferase family 2 protein [Erythrobacter tepidarius]|uniref:glycosyltransferase family 2 protein n=1 Tax=Erythrobacter tepidarius TaxID=60454 RepID=UPI000A3C26E1|nr:glycosyltransferase family 2 protein [Erythrobacter tepidarius]